MRKGGAAAEDGGGIDERPRQTCRCPLMLPRREMAGVEKAHAPSRAAAMAATMPSRAHAPILSFPLSNPVEPLALNSSPWMSAIVAFGKVEPGIFTFWKGKVLKPIFQNRWSDLHHHLHRIN